MKTAKEVSIILAQRAEEIAKMLLPNGKKEGMEWCVGSIGGESGKSLKVHLSGGKSGVWADFATGDGGDLIDLWAIKNNLSLGAALKQAMDYLGIKAPKFEAHQPKTFTRPRKQQLTVPLENCPVVEYLHKVRHLSLKTINDFKISAENNDIVFPYIRDDEIVFIKYLSLRRDDGKKIMRIEKDCEPSLFGWHLIPKSARSVVICEGEIDAMSIYQYGLPALSVPFGGGSGNKHAWIEYELTRLAIFDEIFLCFDNDEEGGKATEEVARRLGQYRCKVVKLPAKDANECLQAKVPDTFFKYYFDKAEALDPEELKRASSFCDKVIDAFYPPGGKEIGYEMPWLKCKDKILFRQHELTVWTGINGHGKSQFLSHAILYMMQNDAKVCMASLELKATRLLLRMTRQVTAMNCPSVEYIKAVHDWYGDKLWLFDLVGQAKSQRLLEVFTYAHQRYGIDVFVIDSFMKLDIDEEDLKAQKRLIEQLCDFKNQYPCHIHIVVHPRKGADENSAPGKLDVKGSGAISDLADNCFSIWRNKQKERLLHKQSQGHYLTDKESEVITMPDCVLKCDKQRNGDWEGPLGFWFDLPTYQYLGGEDHKPSRMIDYSCLKKQ